MVLHNVAWNSDVREGKNQEFLKIPNEVKNSHL